MDYEKKHNLQMKDKEFKLPGYKKPLNTFEPPAKKPQKPQQVFEGFKKK